MARRIVNQGVTLTYLKADDPQYQNRKTFPSTDINISDERLHQLADAYGRLQRSDELNEIALTQKQIVD